MVRKYPESGTGKLCKNNAGSFEMAGYKYLKNKLPVLAMTDISSDVGIIAKKNDFGK